MIDLKELRKLAEQIQEYRELLKPGRSFISENQFAHLMDCLAMLNMKEIIVALDRLEAAEKVCASLFTDFCEWQLDVDALKEWQDKYEKQYESEQEVR